MERFLLMADAAPVLIWMSGTDKRCTWFNRRWLEFVGRSMEQELGEGWVEGVHLDDVDACVQKYVASFDQREPFSMEYRLRRHDGVYRRVLHTAIPLHSPAGELTGYIGSCIDTTDQKLAEESRDRAARHLEFVTNMMEACVTRCTRDLRYEWISRSYGEWIGRTPEEVIGQPIAEIIGEDAFQQLLPHFRRVLAGERIEYEEAVAFPGIGERWIRAVDSPTMNADGIIDGWVAVVTDLTERKRLEDALRDANRRKDTFLATLSHELRNPLAPTRNAAQILQLKGPLSSDAEWARNVIERQTAHMARLIDDLLDVSRIGEDRLELRKSAIDIRTVLEVAIETSHPVLKQYDQELAVSMPRHDVIVEGDATRLAQVFANLLDNAAKFSDRPSTIALSMVECEDSVLISIRDQGIGIAANSFVGLFDRFNQIRTSLDGGRGGLGIGLMLAKGLVEMHGGTIEAASDGLDRGTNFTVQLPIMPGTPYDKPVGGGRRRSLRSPAGVERKTGSEPARRGSTNTSRSQSTRHDSLSVSPGRAEAQACR